MQHRWHALAFLLAETGTPGPPLPLLRRTPTRRNGYAQLPRDRRHHLPVPQKRVRASSALQIHHHQRRATPSCLCRHIHTSADAETGTVAAVPRQPPLPVQISNGLAETGTPATSGSWAASRRNGYGQPWRHAAIVGGCGGYAAGTRRNGYAALFGQAATYTSSVSTSFYYKSCVS